MAENDSDERTLGVIQTESMKKMEERHQREMAEQKSKIAEQKSKIAEQNKEIAKLKKMQVRSVLITCTYSGTYLT